MDWQGRWDRLGRPSVWVGTAIVALVVAGAVVGLSHQPSRSPTSRSATTSALNTGGGAASSGSSPGTVRSSVAATTESRHLMSGATGGGGAAGMAGYAASAQSSASAPSPAATPPPTGSAPSAVPAGLDQPRVVRTAELQVEVRRGSFQRAFDRLSAVAAANGGFVASSSTANGDASSASTGELDLRVPADHFDATLKAVGGLGRTRQEHLQGEDVSGQLVDLDARIKSLQSEEETLRTIVGQAKTVGELLQVQPQLFDVRQQIEQLQAQKSHLDDAAAFSTVHVSLFEPGATPTKPPQPEPETGLAHSLSRAVHGAVAVAGGMVVVVGYVSPFVLLGLLGWAALHVRRRRTAPEPAQA